MYLATRSCKMRASYIFIFFMCLAAAGSSFAAPSYPPLTTANNGRPKAAVHGVSFVDGTMALALQVLAPGKSIEAVRIDNVGGMSSLWRSDGKDNAAPLAVSQGGKILSSGSQAMNFATGSAEVLLALSLKDNGAFAGKATEFRVTVFFADGMRALCSLEPGDAPVTAPAQAAQTQNAPAKADTSQAEPKKRSNEESTRDISDLIERATVFVIAIGSKEADVSLGTGFFVAPGVILTNRHVVGDSNAKVIVLNKALGQPVPAQIVAVSAKANRDYALLRIGKTSSGYPSHLALSSDAKRTDKVGAWGFPSAVIRNDPMFTGMLRGDAHSVPEIVYSEGVISTILKRTPPLIVHTAIISHGNSGGPLMNVNGQVIGINTAISLDDATYRQSGIAISASDIIMFMRECGINPTIVSNPR